MGFDIEMRTEGGGEGMGRGGNGGGVCVGGGGVLSGLGGVLMRWCWAWQAEVGVDANS